MIGEHAEIWRMEGWANDDRARHSAFLMSYSMDAFIMECGYGPTNPI